MRPAYRQLFAILFSLLVAVEAQAAQDLEQATSELAEQLSAALQGKITKVAVVEFSDLSGFQSILGQFISEELVTQFTSGTNAGKFDVVERRLLARVLREQELTDSSLFDAASISKIGKILGIQVLITGSIADLGSEIKINARAISIESAKVFAGASAKLPKTDAVRLMMNQSAGQPSSGEGPRKQLQGSNVYFQNDLIRIDVTAASVSKDQTTVRLALLISNLSQEEIRIALDRNSDPPCNFHLTDENGVSATGEVAGIPCIDTDYNFDSFAPLFIPIGPKVRLPVSFSFSSRNSWGKLYAFSALFLRTQGTQLHKFAVGISDIEAQVQK